MNMIFKYFRMAANVAVSKDDGRSFLLGAVGIRNDGTIIKALNSPAEIPTRQAHAEFRAARKLDANSILFVARIRRDNSYGLAMPCNNCLRVLRAKRVFKVYYTISDEEYDVVYP